VKNLVTGLCQIASSCQGRFIHCTVISSRTSASESIALPYFELDGNATSVEFQESPHRATGAAAHPITIVPFHWIDLLLGFVFVFGSFDGERGSVTTAVIPMTSTRVLKIEPHEASRSRSRKLGPMFHANASITCCESYAAVGSCVTSNRTIFRRSWARMSIQFALVCIGDMVLWSNRIGAAQRGESG